MDSLIIEKYPIIGYFSERVLSLEAIYATNANIFFSAERERERERGTSQQDLEKLYLMLLC